MSFTRSTRNTSVHQGMPDYPTNEGYTTTTLKAAFDAPAEGLQTDINGLMSELESADSAGNVGANPITDGDTSDANVQAKLEKLYADLQGIEEGFVGTNTITQEMMNQTYEATLAKKDGTLQSNLNAEQLGGQSLAAIQALIAAKGHTTGTFTVSYDGSATTGQTVVNHTLNLGFEPSFVIYFRTNQLGSIPPKSPDFGIVVGTKGGYYTEYSDAGWTPYSTTKTSTSIILKEFCVQYGTSYYTYNMSYIAFR